MVVDPNEAVPMDDEAGEEREDDGSDDGGWRARIKNFYRKLLSPVRY